MEMYSYYNNLDKKSKTYKDFVHEYTGLTVMEQSKIKFGSKKFLKEYEKTIRIIFDKVQNKGQGKTKTKKTVSIW